MKCAARSPLHRAASRGVQTPQAGAARHVRTHHALEHGWRFVKRPLISAVFCLAFAPALTARQPAPSSASQLPDGTYREVQHGRAALVVDEGFIVLRTIDPNSPDRYVDASPAYAFRLKADGYLYFRSYPKTSLLAFPGLNCALRWTGKALDCTSDDGTTISFVRAGS